MLVIFSFLFYILREYNPIQDLRPFLTHSASAGRKRPFSTVLFFDRILLVLLLIVSLVDL